MIKKMNVVSFRKNKISDEVSENCSFLKVIKNDNDVISITENKEYLPNIEAKRVLFLVHGFNCEFRDVMKSYFYIANNMKALDIYDEVIGITWAGGDSGLEWRSANEKLMETVPALNNFIMNLYEHSGIKADIMCHSLGNKLIHECLKAGITKFFNNIWMIAPAIEDYALCQGGKYYDNIFYANNTHIFHSSNDGILGGLYRFVEFDDALGYEGPKYPLDGIDGVHVVDCSDNIRRHSGYKNSVMIYSYMKEFLKTNQ